MKSTIEDFSFQWSTYTTNPGYYGSQTLIKDIFEPLLNESDIRHKIVGEIGAGTGRISNGLLQLGAARLVCVEPSEGATSILSNIDPDHRERFEVLNGPGEQIALYKDLDLVVSVGVLHHIEDVAPVMEAARDALRPGGKMFVWLYGKEGNRGYIILLRVLRLFAQHIADRLLWGLSSLAVPLLRLYGRLANVCQWMPMASYFQRHLTKLSDEVIKLTVFDQLNPAYAKYYAQEEAEDLLARHGFVDVRSHHRHGYSWSVVGQKPL